MILAEFNRVFVQPGLEMLAEQGGPPVSMAATRMLLAIALQESSARFRYQILSSGAPGPARGFWQFERGGGVSGVMEHRASRPAAVAMCNALQVEFASASIHRVIEGNDPLAVAFARLLLWTDPHPLPDAESAGWACYLRTWRPGKPKPNTWPNYWRAASTVVAPAN